jgi:hypothetical protein
VAAAVGVVLLAGYTNKEGPFVRGTFQGELSTLILHSCHDSVGVGCTGIVCSSGARIRARFTAVTNHRDPRASNCRAGLRVDQGAAPRRAGAHRSLTEQHDEHNDSHRAPTLTGIARQSPDHELSCLRFRLLWRARRSSCIGFTESWSAANERIVDGGRAIFATVCFNTMFR